jgi:hypothetical protein
MSLMKILLSLLLVIIASFTLFFEVDQGALELYYQNFDRAVYAFALAKGLNAVISVIQSIEISGGFIIEGTIGLGELLDPLNDMIERFSWIMLASSVSIGIQHLLLMLSKTMFLKVALLASIVFSLMFIWFKKLHNSTVFLLSLKLVLLLLILRFSAVAFVYVNESFYNNIYAENYKSATSFIKEYKGELEELQKDKDKLDGYWAQFESQMEVFSKKVIKLITIFVVTTIIFPLLYLWFLVLLLRWIFNMKFDNDKIMLMLNKKVLR